MDEKRAIIESLAQMFETARAEGLFFYCGYQDIWFSPDELEAAHKKGRFIWDAPNWALRDPHERLEQLDAAIISAAEAMKTEGRELKTLQEFVEAQANGDEIARLRNAFEVADMARFDAERHLAAFRAAVEHVTEDGKTSRSFSAPEGWAMVHKDRLLDLEVAEEQLAASQSREAKLREYVASEVVVVKDDDIIAKRKWQKELLALPHATDHLHACTGSNEPGQPGSAYAECKPHNANSAAPVPCNTLNPAQTLHRMEKVE